MKISIEKMPLELIAQELVNGRIDINELNISQKIQREAFLSAVEKRPNLLSKINDRNAEEMLQIAIKAEYKNLVYVKREHYTDKIVQYFISKRFEEKADKKNQHASNFFVQKSLEDKIVFSYYYTTADGDELYYVDKEFGVPTSIKTSFKIATKLVDSVKLVDKLDTHITQLGAEKIKNSIEEIISTEFRVYLNNLIHHEEISYYNLCASYDKIKSEFTMALNEKINDYGLVVSDFVINKIAVPKDMQNKIENLAFQLRQQRADSEASEKLAKISLQHYEEKLAIQDKYPNAPYTLTEYEKDMALKRYLIKMGRSTEEEVDRNIKMSQVAKSVDSQIAKAEDLVPEELPQKENNFRRNFIFAAVVAALVAFMIMFANVGFGLLLLGLVIGIIGIVAYVNYDKLNDEAQGATESIIVEEDK